MQPPSLIVTLQLDPAAQAFFNAQRARYFPAHANYTDAHLTLFHHLPAHDAVQHILAAKASRPTFPVAVTGLFNMGNGVAYTLRSAALEALHEDLQQCFAPWLSQRDRQPLWPHVTIQRKVTAYKAAQLQQLLEQDFRPFTVQALGLYTWHYRKGPWQAAGAWAFTAPA
ncbi:MAG TPA: 2'-5' RNA ligase family protein [Chitinophaga sp.]